MKIIDVKKNVEIKIKNVKNVKNVTRINKMPRYCRDNRAMRPIYECPENCM